MFVPQLWPKHGYQLIFFDKLFADPCLDIRPDWSINMLRKCNKWQVAHQLHQLHPPKKERGKLFHQKRAWTAQRESDVLKRSFHTNKSWDNLSSSKSKVLKHHDSMSVHIEASNASYYSKELDTILYHGIMLSSVCTLRQYQTSITTMLLECENLCRKQFEYSTRCNY